MNKKGGGSGKTFPLGTWEDQSNKLNTMKSTVTWMCPLVENRNGSLRQTKKNKIWKANLLWREWFFPRRSVRWLVGHIVSYPTGCMGLSPFNDVFPFDSLFVVFELGKCALGSILTRYCFVLTWYCSVSAQTNAFVSNKCFKSVFWQADRKHSTVSCSFHFVQSKSHVSSLMTLTLLLCVLQFSWYVNSSVHALYFSVSSVW